ENQADQTYNNVQGNLDIVLFALFANNKPKWTRIYGSPANDSPRALAVASDRLYVGGSIIAPVMVVNNCTLPGPTVGSYAFLFALQTMDATVKLGDMCDAFGPLPEMVGDPSFTRDITGNSNGEFAAAGFMLGPGMVGCTVKHDGDKQQAWMWLG